MPRLIGKRAGDQQRKADKHSKVSTPTPWLKIWRKKMKLDDIHFGGEVKKFFDLPIFNRVRCTDPITSYQAADQIKDVAPKHHQIILQALQEHGAMGKDEIATKTGLNPNAVARRLPELQKMNFVTTTGKTVKSLSGREERQWIATSV